MGCATNVMATRGATPLKPSPAPISSIPSECEALVINWPIPVLFITLPIPNKHELCKITASHFVSVASIPFFSLGVYLFRAMVSLSSPVLAS